MVVVHSTIQQLVLDNGCDCVAHTSSMFRCEEVKGNVDVVCHSKLREQLDCIQVLEMSIPTIRKECNVGHVIEHACTQRPPSCENALLGEIPEALDQFIRPIQTT